MHIRKILTPLVGRNNDQLGLDLGFGLAQNLCAHVSALFVRPDPEESVPYLGFGSVHLEEIKKEYRRYAETTGKKAANRARGQFNSARKRHGIVKAKRPIDLGGTSAHWVEVIGRSTHEVPETAKLCDITVFAGSHADYHRLFPNALECTLLESGRPLLFVPDGSIDFPLERIAIAWHDFDAEARVAPKTHEAVGHALLSAAQEIEASLLVMGGYAHNRFEETVFSGTTLYAMRHSHLPLLMTH